MAAAALGDVRVYREDVSTLRPGCWLNDKVIAYLFELFAHRASDEGLGAHDLLLLEPSTTFTAAMVGDAGILREMLSVSRTAARPESCSGVWRTFL